MSEIENERGQMDLGVTAYRILMGAREDGASWWAAMLVATAFFRGLAPPTPDERCP